MYSLTGMHWTFITCEPLRRYQGIKQWAKLTRSCLYETYALAGRADIALVMANNVSDTKKSGQ